MAHERFDVAVIGDFRHVVLLESCVRHALDFADDRKIIWRYLTDYNVQERTFFL